ncbi:hypothetical protein Tco_0760283 [Tanacetum coccineum]
MEEYWSGLQDCRRGEEGIEANHAMPMITRLRAKKKAVQMKVLQYSTNDERASRMPLSAEYWWTFVRTDVEGLDEIRGLTEAGELSCDYIIDSCRAADTTADIEGVQKHWEPLLYQR